MQFPTRLETSRLLLRQPCAADAKSIFDAYAKDAEVTRFLMWKAHPSVETTNDFISFCLDRWTKSIAFPYVLARKTDGRLLGMIEIRPRDVKAEMGYVLARAHWGQGLMPEAATCVAMHALSLPSLFRVESFCDVENQASARVLEKIGMLREGRLRRYIIHPAMSKEPRDCYLYAMTKDQFPKSLDRVDVG